MGIQTRNKNRQRAGRRTGRVFFVPAEIRNTYQGMFYKQSYAYTKP